MNFFTDSWLEEIERFLDSINNLGIVGVAGMSESGSSNQKRGGNIITHGEPPQVWPCGVKYKSLNQYKYLTNV